MVVQSFIQINILLGKGAGGDFVESNNHVENGIKVMILSQNLTTNLNCYRRN